MRCVYCLILVLCFAPFAEATVRVDEDGTSKGYAKNLDFTNGPSITRSGITATLDFSAITAGDLFEIDINGGLMPTASGATATYFELDGNSDIQPKAAS